MRRARNPLGRRCLGRPGAALLLCLAAWLAALPARAQALLADLSQNQLGITTGFTGAQVLLFGAIEGGGDILVVARGPNHDVVVRRKARVAGIWINGQEARYREIPSYYAVIGTAPAHDILPEDVRRRLGIGIDSLPLLARGPGAAEPGFTEALIGLKRTEGLYGENEVEFALLAGRLFQTRIALPDTVLTGRYLIEVHLVRDQAVVQTVTLPLTVRREGLGAEIWRFSRENELVYGLGAILLAALAGWLGSILFRRG